MDLKSYIKKNKFFSFITTCFLIWLIYLLILSIIAHREVIFYDVLGQKDVSTNFSSSISVARYIVEPFVGLAYIMRDEFEYLVGFLITYVIVRGLYLSLKYKGRVKSKKFHIVMCIMKDFLRFSFEVNSLILLAILAIIGIGYFTIGFFFVSRYFMVIIQIGSLIGFFLVLLKAIYLSIYIFHPKLKFNYSGKKRDVKLKSQPELNKLWIFSRKEIVYYLGIMFLLLFLQTRVISIQFPTPIIETKLKSDEFLFDFHGHTIMSDGWLTPEERVLWYIGQGISGAAFSDHDNTRGARIAQDYVKQNGLDFTVIMAEEYTDHENDIHLNIYGLTEEIVPLESEVLGGPRALNVSDMIKYVKHWGGYVTVNHYNNYKNKNGGIGVPYTYQQLRDWGVDGFEIVNSGEAKAKEIRQFCLANHLICIGGSDVHINEDITTIVKLKLDDPSNKSVANIFKNLRKNAHEVILIDQFPRKLNLPNDLNDIGFKVIERFFSYIINLDSIQVLSWIIWSCGVYMLFFLVYRKIKTADIDSLRKKIL